MLQARIDQFRGEVEEPSEVVADDTRDMALDLLSILAEIDLFAERYEPTGPIPGGSFMHDVPARITETLDQLRNALQGDAEQADAMLLNWVQYRGQDTGFLVERLSAAMTEAGTAETHAQWRQWRVRLRLLQERVTSRLDSDALRSRAKNLVEQTEVALQRAKDASEKAQDAAGMSGNAALGTYFSGYSKQELIAARWFRGLTVLAIAAGVVGVLLQGRLGSEDWTGIVYRVAVAAGAGTLAAYFGRQAGQHRRLYNWARSTQVQLDSFPAFIESVPAAEKGEVYRTLARRVLSAPPEKGAELSDDSVGTAQLVELVTALAKRNALPS